MIGLSNCFAFCISLASSKFMQWVQTLKCCSLLVDSLTNDKTLFKLALEGDRANFVKPMPARAILSGYARCDVGDRAESSCTDTGLVIFPVKKKNSFLFSVILGIYPNCLVDDKRYTCYIRASTRDRNTVQLWHMTAPHNLQWCFRLAKWKLLAQLGHNFTSFSSIHGTMVRSWTIEIFIYTMYQLYTRYTWISWNISVNIQSKDLYTSSPFLSIGSDGKLFNNLSSLIRSLFVSYAYLSSRAFLISLKYFVWDVIAPEIGC